MHLCHLSQVQSCLTAWGGDGGRNKCDHMASVRPAAPGAIRANLLVAQGRLLRVEPEEPGLCRDTPVASPFFATCLTHRGLSQINRNKPSSFPEPAKTQRAGRHVCLLGAAGIQGWQGLWGVSDGRRPQTDRHSPENASSQDTRAQRTLT